MSRKLLWILAAAFAVALLFLVFPRPAGNGPVQNQTANQSRVCFGQECFSVELALTPDQQAFGLMNRTHLDADKGMLFVFSQDGVYPFWMKDTLIPLDMIWMDSGGRVVFIGKDEQPCGVVCPTVNPGKNARYVLELNAGAADRIGLNVGDRAIFT